MPFAPVVFLTLRRARFNPSAAVYANIWKLLDATKHLKYAERKMKHLPPMSMLEGLDVHGPQRAGSPQALRAEPGRLAGLGASLDVKTKSWVEVDGTLRQRLRV